MNGEYRLAILKSAQKDKEKIKQYPALREKVDSLLSILRQDPYQNPPPYEKLKGDLLGFYSRRINVQHRLVYSVHEAEKTVKIAAMWTHYES